MGNRVIPATGYILRLTINKMIVNLLERQADGKYWVDENRFGAEKLVLEVPKGIEVYRVHRKFTEVKMNNELFFTHNCGELGNPAYLSVLERDFAIQKEGKVNLLECQWYGWDASSELLERLNRAGRGLFGGLAI